MRRALRLTAAGAAIICLSALSTPASALAADLPVSGAHVVVHFSLPAGQQPENIALEPDGAADLTFAFTGQVVRVTRGGLIQPLATLRSEEHTSELQSRPHLVCRLLLEKKKTG